MNQLTVPARIDNLDTVLDFLSGVLEEKDVPMKLQLQINIAAEEIFVNIAHYAYMDTEGDATVSIDFENEPFTAVVQFIDSGIPYNPLAKPDPDTTLSAEERSIGGLGIFMVKKSMDVMEYTFQNNRNVLTIKKILK